MMFAFQSNSLISVRDLTLNNIETVVECSGGTLKLFDSSFKSFENLIKASKASKLYLESINVDFHPLVGSTLINSRYIDSLSINNSKFISRGIDPIVSVIKITDVMDSVLISDSYFEGFVTENSALNFVFNSEGASLQIKKSTFMNNTVNGVGGAVNVYRGARNLVAIQNSKFLNNKAASTYEITKVGKGGAIYIDSASSGTNDEVKIEDCYFIENSAALYGGAIYLEKDIANIKNTQFLKNVIGDNGVVYYHDVGTSSLKLEVIQRSPTAEFKGRTVKAAKSLFKPNLETSDELVLPDIGNNAPINSDLYIAIVDKFGQIALYDNSSILLFSKDQNLLELSHQTLLATWGAFRLADLKVKILNSQGSLDGLHKSLSFELTGANTQESTSSAGRLTQEQNLLNIVFRDCGLGEIVLSDNTCNECKEGFAQLDSNPTITSSTCKPCDRSMICKGGSMVGPKEGYARLNESSDIFAKCSRDNICLGAQPTIDVEFSKTGHCNPPNTGILCSDCEDNYAKGSTEGTCFSCEKRFWLYVRLLVAIVIPLAMIGYSTKQALLASHSYDHNAAGQNVSLIKTIALRILMNYVQIVALIESIPIDWPDSMSSAATGGSSVTFAWSNSFVLECFFLEHVGKDHQLPKPMLRLLIVNLIPVIYLGIAVIFWALYFIKNRKKIAFKIAVDDFITTAVIIFSNVQPMIIQNNLKFLECENLYKIDEPASFLKSDYNIQCWTGQHNAWATRMVIPLLVLWGLIGPGSLFFYLRKNKDRLMDDKIKRKFSFFYRGYSTKNYYWEFIILIRKYSLIIIVFFASGYRFLQIYLSLYAIWVALIYHGKHQPFVNATLNRIEKLGLFSALLFNFAGIYFYGINSVYALTQIIAALAIAINVYFLFNWGKLFIKTYSTYIYHMVFKTNSKVKIFCSFLMKPLNAVRKAIKRRKKNKKMEKMQTLDSERNFVDDMVLSSERNLKSRENSQIDIKNRIMTDEIIDFNSLDGAKEESKDSIKILSLSKLVGDEEEV